MSRPESEKISRLLVRLNKRYHRAQKRRPKVSEDEGPLFAGVRLNDLKNARKTRSAAQFYLWLLERPARLILLSFAFVILTGTLLLMLPIASESRQLTGPLTALFTATSASCVTGLVLVDTATYWSGFGEAVILILIQIGGLSLLTILSAFGLGMHRKMTLSTTRALQDTTGSSGIGSTFQMVKRVIQITCAAESIGSIFSIWRFSRILPLPQAIWKGIFHSISAFCNAGFDLMGDVFTPYSSLCQFQNDPWLLFSTAALIISGGLGFLVWIDLLHWRPRRGLAFHSQLVLGMSGLLLLSGFIFFYFYEGSRSPLPLSLAELPPAPRALNAFFQSVTLRTAGFNSIDQYTLSPAAKLLSTIFMTIGAGPASTAGGIKVTTFAILVAGVTADFRAHTGEGRLSHHRIDPALIRRSFSIFMMGLSIVLLGSFIIAMTLPEGSHPPITLADILFETSSAFGTVGLSSATTSHLGAAARPVLILAMFVGRVGPASLALSFITSKQLPARQIYPEGRTFVG